MNCYNWRCGKVQRSTAICADCSEWEKCPDFDGVRPQIDEPYAIKEKESDPVNHPEHYSGPHECIDLMQALFGKEDVMAFCRCNSFKYRFRAGKKEGADAEEDLKKAEWYEDFLIELRQREGL